MGPTLSQVCAYSTDLIALSNSISFSISRRVMASESLTSAWKWRATWLDKLIWVSQLPSITKIIIEVEGMDETFYFEGRESIQRVFGGVVWQPRSADAFEGWPQELWDFARLASDNVAEKLYTQEMVDAMVDAGLEAPVVSRWIRKTKTAPACYRLAG